MKTKKSFTRETLDKIRSESDSGKTHKSRKTGRIILVLDAVVIVLILLFFFGKNSKTLYKSTVVTLDSIEYRLSVTADEERPDVIFSLSIKNKSDRPRTFPFKNKIATLTVTSLNSAVLSQPFKLHSFPLILPPGDNHVVSITCLKDQLHPVSPANNRKNKGFLSLFGKRSPSNPVNALAEIYLNNILALNLTFTF